jgi:hypothetical protein
VFDSVRKDLMKMNVDSSVSVPKIDIEAVVRSMIINISTSFGVSCPMMR